MSLMNPQTQIKSSKLSVVSECDTRFRNNTKFAVLLVYLLLCCEREKRPKTNYRLSRSQYAFEGGSRAYPERDCTKRIFSFLLLTSCYPLEREKKVLVSSATLCRASLIQNKLTERLRRQRSQPSSPPPFFSVKACKKFR